MRLILRLLVVAGLAVDAYVHIHLAGDSSHKGTISESTLFWIQGFLAAAVALLVLFRPRFVPYIIAFLVSASALGAVILYRYVDFHLSPLPDMYEPVWYTEKVVTTIAEAVATVASAIGILYAPGRSRSVEEAGERDRPVNV
jgi:hypothetical protein